MNITSVFALLSLIFTLQSAPDHPAKNAAGPDLRAIAQKYLSAERDRQAQGATEKTVEAALAFLTDTVVYEHARVGARIEGKDALRKGMLNFLGTTRNARDEVVSQLSGPGVVVLELKQSFEAQRDGRWEAQTRNIVKVLEFDGENIRRVIDYW